ncbi:MAG: hypothetical protein L3K01_05685 [Thermoplasmata archaeon]|nr:hypothetical protein [Thermoplasmata archaeon]
MAVLVLTWGTEPSAWTTFVVVGAVVAALGGLLLLLAAEYSASGSAHGFALILGFALLAAGAATVLGGVGLRLWGRERPEEPPVP